MVADKDRGTNTIVLSVSPFLKKQGIPSRCRIKELPKKYNYIYAVPRMERYLEKSAEVINVLYHFVAEEDVHVYSIDEAFVDLTSYLPYYNKTPLQMVTTIINQIKEETGLQATAGIGDNFFLGNGDTLKTIVFVPLSLSATTSGSFHGSRPLSRHSTYE